MTAPHLVAGGSAPDQVLPPAARPCGCPSTPGVTVTDETKHAAWHALVVEQGGPTGAVDAVTLRSARGFKNDTFATETILDVKNRATGRSVSGARRRAARGES